MGKVTRKAFNRDNQVIEPYKLNMAYSPREQEDRWHGSWHCIINMNRGKTSCEKQYNVCEMKSPIATTIMSHRDTSQKPSIQHFLSSGMFRLSANKAILHIYQESNTNPYNNSKSHCDHSSLIVSDKKYI